MNLISKATRIAAHPRGRTGGEPGHHFLRTIVAAAMLLFVGTNAALAQGSAPPPVPALPDTDRVQSYSISSSTCACSVGFALYGDTNDYQNWLTVYVNGIPVAYNDGTYGWSISSPTGALATIPRPITDAVLTFNNAQTGTVYIIGARRPRRVAQFAENRGVAARDLNQALTDVVAQNRETWDLWERTVTFEPGFTPNALPLAANRAGKFLCFDNNGQPTICAGSSGSTSFGAGTGVAFTGSNPTIINTNLSAGVGVAITGTNPQVISRAPVPTRAVSSNDTASSSDCGKLILASGYITLTLPAANSVPSGCRIGYKNTGVYTGIGSARGKILANFPADFAANNILYPSQSGEVTSDGTNWYTSVDPGRWLIPTNVELCVRQDGSNTSDGLGNGTVASDCLATIQRAVTIIGTQFDGGGYNACNVGLYAGGTSIFSEAVTMTGQSVGCYLTFNFRGAITHTSTTSCYTGGDNGIAIWNTNLGFAPIFRCNTSNAGSIGAFYCHQTCIFDIIGPMQWVPGGTNDQFLFVDGQGRVTANFTGAGLVVGDGATRSFNNMFQCDQHCAQIQVSGSVGFSANVTGNRIFAAYGGSLMNTNASFAGSVTGITTSIASGYSVLNINGTTIPGGTTTSGTGGPGQVCTSKC